MKRIICPEPPNPDKPVWTVIRKLDRAIEAAGEEVSGQVTEQVTGQVTGEVKGEVTGEVKGEVGPGQSRGAFRDDLLTGRVRVPETIMEGAAEA